MNKEAVEKLRGNLTKKVDGFNMSANDFEKTIQDSNKRNKLYNNMRSRIDGFTMSEEEFNKRLGFEIQDESKQSIVETQQEDPETISTIQSADVVEPSKRTSFWKSVFSHNPYPASVQEQKEKEEEAKAIEEETRSKYLSNSGAKQPAPESSRGGVRNFADFGLRTGIVPTSTVPTVGEILKKVGDGEMTESEMRKQISERKKLEDKARANMGKVRQEYAQEVYDRRYKNINGAPKDSFFGDMFDAAMAGIGTIAATPFKLIESAENFGIDIDNAVRGTNMQHGQGVVTRFFDDVLGIGYLRGQIEHYTKEADRYQDNKGIVETAFDGELGTAAGKAVLATIQSAPNLAVSIYSGKKGMESFGGVFLGTTAALQKYDEIKDNEDISSADKALAMFGAFVSECVPEIIGAKRYGKFFNQKTVGAVRKETQQEVLNGWQKFVNSNWVKKSGLAWDWFMKYFGEGTTEAMTDIMNLGIDLALGIKDEVTKQDLMSIGDSFIVGQLSDIGPSSVHFYQQNKYKGIVEREINNNPMLSGITQQLGTTPDKIAEISSKRMFQENVSDKEAELFNNYQEAIGKRVNEIRGLSAVIEEAGLKGNPAAYLAYNMAAKELSIEDGKLESILTKPAEELTEEDSDLLKNLSSKMSELAGTEELAMAAKGRSVPRTMKSIIVSGSNGRRTRATVFFEGEGVVFNDDGSIDAIHSNNLSIKNYRGEEIKGNKRAEWIESLNAVLRNEFSENAAREEIDKLAKQRAADEKANKDMEEQKKEQARRQMIADISKDIPMDGVSINAKKATPAQTFVWNLQQNGQEEAISRAARSVGRYMLELEVLKETKTMLPEEQDAAIDKANIRIAGYKDIVSTILGEQSLQQLERDSEGIFAQLLKERQDAASEEERARLERIAEKQRRKEENRTKYQNNLQGSEKSSTFAPESETRSSTLSVNITQNAGEDGSANRIGDANEQDRLAIIDALDKLRNPEATDEQKLEEEKKIEEILERRKAQLVSTIEDVLKDVNGVRLAGIKKGIGVYKDSVEYTFKALLDVEEGFEESATAAMAMVAEITKQDSFIINYQEGSDKLGDAARQVRVRLKRQLTPEEQAALVKAFSDAQMEGVPAEYADMFEKGLGATITEDGVETSYFPPYDKWDKWESLSDKEKLEITNLFVDNILSLLNSLQYGITKTGLHGKSVHVEMGRKEPSRTGEPTKVGDFKNSKGEVVGQIEDRYNYSNYNTGEENGNERDYSRFYKRQPAAEESNADRSDVQETYLIPEENFRTARENFEASEAAMPVAEVPVSQTIEEPVQEEPEEPSDLNQFDEEPVDLNAEDVVLMVTGTGGTRQRYVFARKSVDENGNVTYTSLGNPFNAKVPKSGKKLPKNWGEINKENKKFYVTDSEGNPVDCYALTTYSLTEKKWRPGEKLNALVASTGEVIRSVMSMPNVFIKNKDGVDVSIIKGENKENQKIEIASVASLLDYPIVLRRKFELLGQDEIAFTLRDLLYSGKFEGESHVGAKNYEDKKVKMVSSHPYSIAIEKLREESRNVFGADRPGEYTKDFNNKLKRLFEAWNNFCKENGLTNLSDEQLRKLKQHVPSLYDLFWSARLLISNGNPEIADKASLEISTYIDTDSMSAYMRNNPLHQLAVMLYIGNVIEPGIINAKGIDFSKLPSKSAYPSKGNVKNVQKMVTKKDVERARERYAELKSGKATYNVNSFTSLNDELETLEFEYPEVLDDSPVHNRPAKNLDNAKKVDSLIHDNKVKEEVAKKAAIEAGKTDEEREAEQYAALENTINDGFAAVEKAAAEKDNEAFNKAVSELSIYIEGNDSAKKRLSDIVASYMASITPEEEEKPKRKPRKKAEKKEASKAEEQAQEPAPAEPVQETPQEPVAETPAEAAPEATPAFDASSLNGMTDEDLKERRDDLWIKNDMQGLTAEEEAELAEIEKRLGHKIYKGSDNNDKDVEGGFKALNELSVSPEQKAKTAKSQVLGNFLTKLINRNRSLGGVHVLTSQAEMRKVLANILSIPELMSAYHGTDAVFDKFDLSFVGKGEGAQAYGYGVYVSRNYGVARSYARKIAGTKDYSDKQIVAMAVVTDADMGDIRSYNSLVSVIYGRKREAARMAISNLLELKNVKVHQLVSEILSNKEGDFFGALREYANRITEEDLRGMSDKEERIARNAKKDAAYIDACDELISKVEKMHDNGVDWWNIIEELRKEGKPIIYDVEIPDDNGTAYIPWNEEVSDEQLDMIYAILPELKERGYVDYGITGSELYFKLENYVGIQRAGVELLYNGHSVLSSELYNELENYFKTIRPSTVMEIHDDLVSTIEVGLRKGLSIQESIESAILTYQFMEGECIQQEKEGYSLGFGSKVYHQLVSWLEQNKDTLSSDRPKFLDGVGREDMMASRILSKAGFSGIKVPVNFTTGHIGDNGFNYVIFDENNVEIKDTTAIEYLKDPNGTIYGFAIGDEIYLTPEGLNADTPIHEYTHLWVKALRISNPKAWEKIVAELKRNKSLWESVTNDENYKDLVSDDAIASEVLARYSGKNGGELLEKLAKDQKFGSEKLEEAFLNRVRKSLRNFWQRIAELLHININNTKDIDSISDWVLRDLFDGKELDLTDREILEEMDSIKKDAIKNGTFMKAPNGKASNLQERQWLLVRTKAFKKWFGDWENDPLNASKVVDENGEPLVVYHGTRWAGFGRFAHTEDWYTKGFYTTDNRMVASGYTNSNPKEIPTDAKDAIVGDDVHEGVYSLFLNIRKPLYVDFADKDGNKSRFDQYHTGRWVVYGDEERGIEEREFGSEEEANAYAEQFGGADIEEIMTSTDAFANQAASMGFDGCIFTNVYDGNRTLDVDMTDYVALEPNQLKSVNNKGYFSTLDDRIEYQYTLEQLNEHNGTATAAVERASELASAMGDVLSDDGAEQSRLSNIISKCLDQMEGMRLLQDSLAAYRRTKGEEPLPDKYDIRNKFESKDTISMNKIRKFNHTIAGELNEAVVKFADVIKDSEFYKKHKKEVGGEKPTTLTCVEFIGRYLIARNDYERAKEGVARGMATFEQRMGMSTEQFWREFQEAYDQSLILELWDKIKVITNFELETAVEGGLITREEFDRLMAKPFYVPQRGFWDEVNPENEGGDNELRIVRNGGKSKIELSSMKKAKGGKSLAENPLVYIYRDAQEAIIKSENNKVKVALYDMLRENRDWCAIPEVGISVPATVTYTQVDGNWEKLVNGYTEKEAKEKASLERRLEDAKYRLAEANDEQKNILLDLINELDGQLAALEEGRIADEFSAADNRVIYNHKNKSEKRNTIGVLINGIQHEITLPKNFILTAQAFNGVSNKKGALDTIRTWSSFMAAQFTVNNPTFWSVNLVRDIGFVTLKGGTEYGWEFERRFYHYLRACQKSLNSYLWNGVVNDNGTEEAFWLQEFLEQGGNTGLFNNLDLEKFRYDVRKMNPEAKEGNQKRLSRLADIAQWAMLQPVANYLNEWSELTSRFAIFCAIKKMGMSTNEAVKASHNLSVNFNRRGLGWELLNAFSSITVFVNATLQGSSGFWRTFGAGYGANKTDKIKKALKAGCVMASLPMFLGAINAILLPDDDDEERRISDWDRDNYFCLPNGFKIAIPQEIRPFWCMGSNIGLIMSGSRTWRQAISSILKSIMTNAIPIPQNLSNAAALGVDNLTGDEYHNTGEILRTIFTPSFMETLGQIAENKNFLGGKLRYDFKDWPEYEMAPNESIFYRDLSYAAYRVGGGDPNVASKHRSAELGSKMSQLWDINPKQIKPLLFFIPSGTMDAWVTLWGGGRAAIDVATGNYDKDKNYVQWKDAVIANRFYRPINKDAFRYAVKKQAKAIIDEYDAIANNAKDNIVRNAALGDTKKEEAAIKRYQQVLLENAGIIEEMKVYQQELNAISRRALQNRLKLMNDSELKDVVGIESYNTLDEQEKEIIEKLVYDIKLIQGLANPPQDVQDINVIE